MEQIIRMLKNLGKQELEYESLPYAVVRGAWEGSLMGPLIKGQLLTVLNYVVPAGLQLKILFLRVWTQSSTGAIFRIFETHPTAAGLTGSTEAYPVVGSTPAGVVDYPMLEAAGAEIIHGNLKQPVHVCEGSLDFQIMGPTPTPPGGDQFGFVWWGVVKSPEKP